MNNAKIDALYLFEHYKQSGAGLADMLYQRLIKRNGLKVWEAQALKREFSKLLKAANNE